MATKNIKTTGDLESRVTVIEARIAALEQLSKKFNRKKREYTPEQKAAIRARLLAGQEAAMKSFKVEDRGTKKVKMIDSTKGARQAEKESN